MSGTCPDMAVPTKIDAIFCVPSPYWTTYRGVGHYGSTFCPAVTEFFRALLNRIKTHFRDRVVCHERRMSYLGRATVRKMKEGALRIR